MSGRRNHRRRFPRGAALPAAVALLGLAWSAVAQDKPPADPRPEKPPVAKKAEKDAAAAPKDAVPKKADRTRNRRANNNAAARREAAAENAFNEQAPVAAGLFETVRESAASMFAPGGVWAEVVYTDNRRWMVVQNAAGQQFPVAFESVGIFLTRWPTTLANLTPQTLVEGLGFDVGSNTLQTTHVDVYEGSAQTLVSPTILSVLGENRAMSTRMMSPFNPMAQYDFMMNLPINPNIPQIPPHLYVVGNVVTTMPLRVAVPPTNVATIVPANGVSFTLTQVTRGAPLYPKPNDLVYMVVTGSGAKSLVVRQLVLYKSIPINEFQP